MPPLFIASRSAVDDASVLIADFGAGAAVQAAARAEVSRTAGNVLMFCHWRGIERLIEALASQEVGGTVH